MDTSTAIDETNRPICVDLDGTLLRTDTLVEAVFSLLKRNVLYLFLLPFWLRRGKAYLKAQIARRIDIDASLYPYNEAFLHFLKSQNAAGRSLILATAADEKIGRAVADHLGIFSKVFASNGETNLSGRRKLQRLKDECGEKGFDYAGNAKIDLEIWEHAANAIVVSPERGVRKAAERRANVIHVFDDGNEKPFASLLKAMRLHQWLKNLLLFIPLVMAHEFGDAGTVMLVALAFLSFGLCASSVYLLNDLLDLSDDRRHATKRNRPFAAGTLSVWHGAIALPTLLVISFVLAALIRWEFFLILCVYYVTTLSYSFRLKAVGLLDVIVLAGLYTVRVIAGGAAAWVPLSFWLLAFSMFLFLSLALVKRYTELLAMKLEGKTEVSGRRYWEVDLETLAQFGSSSAFMAVMVLALYIHSEEVTELYSHPEVIWLLCPLMLYIIGRIWLLARRDQVHEDPVVFVMRDRRSQIYAMLGAILLWLAV